MNNQAGLQLAQQKMRDAGVHDIAIDVFSRFYNIVSEGKDSFIREAEIEPLTDLQSLSDVLEQGSDALKGDGSPALAKTAIVKLNGGLGTSMGMQQAKSLLPVRDGLTFLDVLAKQVLHAREHYGVDLPVLFMNSFRTHQDTLDLLAAYPSLQVGDIPLTMLQNREPKLAVDSLEPASYEQDPDLEWCPPGHGDVYTVLQSSGALDALEAAGYEYLNISNVDNLGAYPSAEIAEWFASSGSPFAAETVRRTPADRKGGHVVVRDGQLVLRETAQTHADDANEAADIEKHRYFNANTLWIRIDALRALLSKYRGVLPLPLIQNIKTVNPSDKSSTKVVQLESAMGAAIELFEGAVALEIDRSRFLPVKTTNDLLLLRSDVYELSEEFRLVAKVAEPLITLDPAHFALIDDFDQAFSQGAPSLVEASSLTIQGPWRFGEGVRAVGDALLQNPDTKTAVVPEGATINSLGLSQ